MRCSDLALPRPYCEARPKQGHILNLIPEGAARSVVLVSPVAGQYEGHLGPRASQTICPSPKGKPDSPGGGILECTSAPRNRNGAYATQGRRAGTRLQASRTFGPWLVWRSMEGHGARRHVGSVEVHQPVSQVGYERVPHAAACQAGAARAPYTHHRHLARNRRRPHFRRRVLEALRICRPSRCHATG